MTRMEGEGRAPKPTGPQPRAREDAPTARNTGHGVRSTLESIDLEDVESVPASVDDVSDGIDIDVDLDVARLVDELVEATTEAPAGDLLERAKPRFDRRARRDRQAARRRAG
mgnify:CR=1 FL=1